MRIEKTAHGWLIEPSTSSEEKTLTSIVDVLQQTHCAGASTEDSSPASR